MASNSIEIEHAARRYKTPSRAWTFALRDFSISIKRGDRIAILGPEKSGKTTALRVICGTEMIQAGTANRGLAASWPIPYYGFVSREISVPGNIRFIARMYGLDERDYLRRVVELADLRDHANLKLGKLSRKELVQLSYAVAFCVDFDVYLFDGPVAQGDEKFKERATGIVKSLGPDRAVVIATAQPRDVAELCDQAYVLDEGGTIYYANISEGLDHLKVLNKRVAERQAQEKADA